MSSLTGETISINRIEYVRDSSAFMIRDYVVAALDFRVVDVVVVAVFSHYLDKQTSH